MHSATDLLPYRVNEDLDFAFVSTIINHCRDVISRFFVSLVNLERLFAHKCDYTTSEEHSPTPSDTVNAQIQAPSL